MFSRGLIRLTASGVRRLASKAAKSGETVTTIIKDSDGKKTSSSFKTITKIRETWNNASPVARYTTYAYLTGMTLNNVFSTYNAGKQELLEYREKKNSSNYSNSSLQYKNDWEAVYTGCSQDSFWRFWNSLFWFTQIFSHTVPQIVILFNPEEDKKNST